jgi:acetyl-CoA carboxylase carboxyl transferase subunit alpha
MKLTSSDMKKLGLVDGVIKEPIGGAHSDPDTAYKNVKTAIEESLVELKALDSAKRINARIKKFSSMGHYEEA